MERTFFSNLQQVNHQFKLFIFGSIPNYQAQPKPQLSWAEFSCILNFA